MNALKNIWDTVSYTGVHRELGSEMKKKVVLTNRFAFFAATFAFVTGFAFIKIPFIYAIFILSLFVYLFSIILNRLRAYNAARWLLVVSAPLFNIVVAGLLTDGPNISNRFTLIVLILCPVIFFQVTEPVKMWIGVAWILLCFLVFDYVTGLIPRYPEIKFDNQFDNSALVVYRGAVTIIFFVLAFLYLMQLNLKNEKRLAESLLHTKNKNNIIQEKNRLLERQNASIKMQQAEIEIINGVLRSRALRAQMDPHFLFNALNSIQHFIMQKETNAALSYMSKFSKLIRQVLENSVNETVTVADEIKALAYYLDLEQLRFENTFTYTIEIDETIDRQNTEIPGMLLQPYVENAVLHGLVKKNTPGVLKIKMLNQYEYLLFVIEDNGIGRKASAGLKETTFGGHISRAAEINYNRIAMMQHNAHIITLDLTDDAGKNAGTRVEIKIPYNT